MMRQRKKSDKLLVWYPQKGWIFHSTNESTYLKVLKYIGGERLSKVALKISHLPLLTKEPYPQFSKYMKSIGAGWFVNTIGGTASKYAQLNTINEQLHLNMKVKLVSDDVFDDMDARYVKNKGIKIDLGGKRTRKIDDPIFVDFNGESFDLKNRSGREVFVKLIESIGIKKVINLNLKNGSEDFVTPMHIYGNQYPCGDFWISIPGSTKGKHKILLTIKALLKLDMTIKSISKEERKEKKLKELRQKIDELLNETKSSDESAIC